MPKLAVVTGSFPAYTERFFAREMTELARRGVDFTIFALRENPEKLNDPEFDALRPRVEYLPGLFCPEHLFRCFQACFTLFGSRGRERIKTAMKGLTRRQLVSASRGHLLTARLRKRGFTHVYAHFANAPSTLGWVAANEANLPIAFSFHARDILVEAQLLATKVAAAQAVFVCHRGALEKIKREIPNASNVIQMHHGLKLENFPYQEFRPKNPHVLFASGRNVPKKGWDVLIAALKLLKLEYRAVFAGEGLQNFASDKIEVRNFLSEAEVIQQYRNSSLFVAPYINAKDGDADGIPNAVMEAMALGTPVVGSDAGSLPEILNDVTGWVAKAGDAAALAATLEEALLHPQTCANRSLSARKEIETSFDLSANFQIFMDTFLADSK